MKSTPKVVFHVITGSDLKLFFIVEVVCSPLIYTTLHKLYANDIMAILGSMASSSLINRGSRLVRKSFIRGDASISIQDFLKVEKSNLRLKKGFGVP